MVQPTDIRFLWSDAWLLLAISLAAGDRSTASLASVVSAADGIQHAIPAKDEMDGAIGRLQRAGYVHWSNDVVELTQTGREFLTRATGRIRELLKQQDAIEAALNAASWTEDSNPHNARAGEAEYVPDADWNQIMTRYRSDPG